MQKAKRTIFNQKGNRTRNLTTKGKGKKNTETGRHRETLQNNDEAATGRDNEFERTDGGTTSTKGKVRQRGRQNEGK